MHFLAHDELQTAVLWNRGNRVFAYGDRHQRIDQRLRMQPHQMRTVLR